MHGKIWDHRRYVYANVEKKLVPDCHPLTFENNVTTVHNFHVVNDNRQLTQLSVHLYQMIYDFDWPGVHRDTCMRCQMPQWVTHGGSAELSTQIICDRFLKETH